MVVSKCRVGLDTQTTLTDLHCDGVGVALLQFDWAHHLKEHHAKHYHVNTIFFTEYETKVGNQKFGSWHKVKRQRII